MPVRPIGIKLIATTRDFWFKVPRYQDRWSLRLMGVKTYHVDDNGLENLAQVQGNKRFAAMRAVFYFQAANFAA